jgi:nicotinic acid mononucleotide adenylyltransferase
LFKKTKKTKKNLIRIIIIITIRFFISKKNKNKISNNKIKYINNINNNIHSTDYRNNIDKPKKIFYTFRTEKFWDDSKDNNNIKESLNYILYKKTKSI